MLFPIVALLGASGIIVGILNSYDEFSIPALAPVAWNLAIILGLVLGVPQAHTADGKLYVYAGSIVVGTVIQVLLPVPWLRGRGGRLELVIDWRDPAVRQVLKLMLPVALGLGLINFNALVDGVIAANRIDADLGPSAIDAAFRIYMLPQGVFSVAVATVLFPSLARFASRGDMTGLPQHGVARRAADRVPARAVEHRRRGARRAADAPDLPARRVHGRPDAGRGGVARRVRARADVQRDDADAEPRVLQPAVELDPDARRAREPVREPRARPRVRAARRLGHPARDVARQHRRHRDAARPAPAACRPDPLRRGRRLVVADRGRACSRAARRSASGTGSTTRSAAALLGQIVSLGLGLTVAGPCTSAVSAAPRPRAGHAAAPSAPASAAADALTVLRSDALPAYALGTRVGRRREPRLRATTGEGHASAAVGAPSPGRRRSASSAAEHRRRCAHLRRSRENRLTRGSPIARVELDGRQRCGSCQA